MSDYIPLELIPNILTRLPSADVLRCTSVCKAWYDLITSSAFMFSHLKLSIPNQESRLLVKYTNEAKEQCYNLYRDNQTCDFIEELDSQLVTRVNGYFGIVGSYNGLVCLTEFGKRDINPAIILLWNPSIRKLFKLPKPRIIYKNLSIGFCYIPETNDYKIVRVSKEDGQIGVEMYQLSSNSWHYVDVGDFAYELWSDRLEGFLSGSLHGVSVDLNDDVLIVSLDMRNERFGTLMLPSCIRNQLPHIFTFKESLCVIVHSSSFSFDVWVMNEYGVEDSWAMQFKIDYRFYGEHCLCQPLYVRDSDEIIFEEINEYLVSYDHTNNRVTKIGGCEMKESPDITSYTESLVLLKSPE